MQWHFRAKVHDLGRVHVDAYSIHHLELIRRVDVAKRHARAAAVPRLAVQVQDRRLVAWLRVVSRKGHRIHQLAKGHPLGGVRGPVLDKGVATVLPSPGVWRALRVEIVVVVGKRGVVNLDFAVVPVVGMLRAVAQLAQPILLSHPRKENA